MKSHAHWPARAIPIFVVSVVCFRQALAAEELTFVPYAELGQVNYSPEISGDFDLPGGFDPSDKQSFDVVTLKVGLAATYGDWYVNTHHRRSNEATDVQVITGFPTVKWVGDRTESSLAIGYDVSERISLFGGYRDAETSADGSLDSKTSFTHDGFFFGASFFLEMTETGGFTFSAGYAWLDADVKGAYYGVPLPDASGDGDGYKLGLSWRDLFNDQWGYSLSAEFFRYDFDLDAGEAVELQLREEEIGFSVGIFYVF